MYSLGNQHAIILACMVLLSLLISNQCTQTDKDLSSTPSPAQSIFSKFLPRRKLLVRRHLSSQKREECHPSYRPYFTYWVTFVQILVCIVSLIVYGYAPLTSTRSVSLSSVMFLKTRISLEKCVALRTAATLRSDDESVVWSTSGRSDSPGRQVYALYASTR